MGPFMQVGRLGNGLFVGGGMDLEQLVHWRLGASVGGWSFGESEHWRCPRAYLVVISVTLSFALA